MGNTLYLLPLLAVLILLNFVPWRVMRWHVHHWVAEERQRHARLWIAAFFLLLNLPLAFFFFRPLDSLLWYLPAGLMPVAFLPSEAWVLTLLLYVACVTLMSAGWMLLHKWRERRASPPSLLAAIEPTPVPRLGLAVKPSEANDASSSAHLLARRKFLVGGMSLAVPAVFGISSYSLRGALDGLEISPELPISFPNLSAALEGFRIVQISDIHVGPYMRRAELESVATRVNALRPDLVVITGDLLDRDIASLPDAVAGLRGLRASMAGSGEGGPGVFPGIFMVLGNHDLYADPATAGTRGGERIVEALRGIGIRTLRDEAVIVGEGDERLAVLGLDWIDPRRGPSYLFYDEARTTQALTRMNTSLLPDAHTGARRSGAQRSVDEVAIPRILLAHHPETFTQAQSHGIPLTLAGHTHGGGQIVLGHVDGQPVGVSALRFHYRSGLYQHERLSLYVNRGLGYMGLPIRINCPSEISQFRLTRA